MKKNKLLLGWFIFLFTFSSLFWAYTPSKEELKLFDRAETLINDMYKEKPNKAYAVQKNIWSFFVQYKNSEAGTFLLKFIEKTTEEFINDYEIQVKVDEEKKEQENKDEDKQKEEWQTIPKIDNKIDEYNRKLDVLKKDTTTVAQFELTPKNDSIFLKNVYLQNTWTVKDITRIFEEVYLVDRDNRIYAKWYVQDDYLYFDINNNALLKEWANNEVFIKAILREASNKNEVWEIVFKLATPSNATYWTLNWINATSYANWKYVTINDTKINNPIKTHISYNNTTVWTETDFTANYNEGLYFSIANNSDNRLELKAFDIKISWSAVNTLNSDVRFVVKVKWTNQIFWTAFMSDRNSSTWIIRVNYGWWTSDYISHNSKTEYVVEIEHKSSNPSWTREMRLENIVIWDWFGGTISNLNEFSNTGVPGDYYIYRY